MAKTSRKKPESKCELARQWLRKHRDGRRAEYMEKTGRSIGSSEFSKAREDEGLPKLIGKRASRKEPLVMAPAKLVVGSGDSRRLAQLEDQVAFLRWWNHGERCGFVDRLIQESQRGTP